MELMFWIIVISYHKQWKAKENKNLMVKRIVNQIVIPS